MSRECGLVQAFDLLHTAHDLLACWLISPQNKNKNKTFKNARPVIRYFDDCFISSFFEVIRLSVSR